VIAFDGDDRAAVARANQAGLAVEALSAWRLDSQGSGGVIMCFTNVTSGAMADALAQRLWRAVYDGQ